MYNNKGRGRQSNSSLQDLLNLNVHKFPKDKQNVVGAMMDASFYFVFFSDFFPCQHHVLIFDSLSTNSVDTLFFISLFFRVEGECVC